MKPRLLTIPVLLALGLLFASEARAQTEPTFQDPERQKLAQTGFKFLSMSVDPRAAAMGNAMVAQDVGASTAMFYNPAAMAYQQGTLHLGINQAQWIADINYNAGSISFSPALGAYGVFGVSVVAVDYGDFIGTIRANNNAGYEDTEVYSPSAMAVGVGYARALTDRFAVGGNVKYARQDLGTFAVGFNDDQSLDTDEFAKSTVAFDFGVLYHTGFRSLTFAMNARNFSRELTYAEETFELPLTFDIGVAMDVMDLTGVNQELHSLQLALEAERPRDFAEQLKVGAEYLFMNTLALRAGYIFPTDVQGMNLGVGVQRDFGTFGFAFNYAYSSFDVFDSVNRLGVQLAF